MTSTISKHFSDKGGSKRKPSLTSSGSDGCTSPEVSDTKRSQERKKQRHDSEVNSTEDVALQESICELQATVSKLATKEDIQKLEAKVDKLTTALTNRIEKLESNVFELESEADKLKSEVSKLKGQNTELQGRLTQFSKEATNFNRQLNDQEQHGRQWNVRVYGVPEAKGEATVEDCVSKCLDVFSKKLGVPVTASDVDVAHRTGRAAMEGGRPRPILVRFFSRRQRGQVLTARRKLKQTGVSIGEDLTQGNYKLLRKVNTHSATLASWSSNGKILAKWKNGKTIKVDIDTDIDSLFMKEMT